jgi:formate hydrogenlyase subunit 3/multisubunit Na+/H+ antiporter MnhD subunit
LPTPVSALLHAATLVTAGIFLLLRISPVLEFAPLTLTVLTFLGGLTAFLGGSLGLVANDMKKVIAYSTMSQLGYEKILQLIYTKKKNTTKLTKLSYAFALSKGLNLSPQFYFTTRQFSLLRRR